MGLRLVMRWVALGAPYPWFGFATHFEAHHEVVGAEFFRDLARRLHATFQGAGTDTGLIEDFSTLGSRRFDPSRVAPAIWEFYEHTTRFTMDITVKWNPLIRPLGALYDRFIARRMQQLDVPLDRAALSHLDSWIELVTLKSSDRPDLRCWIRVDKDTRAPIYIGAYKTYRSVIDGNAASYVTVAFPIPGGSVTTVLTPRNLDSDGLELTTRVRDSTEVGVYLILPHRRSFSMTPAFGLSERFRLRPAKEQGDRCIEVQHDCYWLGMHAFRMHYHISPKAQAQVLRAAGAAGNRAAQLSRVS